MKNNIPHLFVILGPTASGKTGLAARLACEFNLEIVSADSRQVYQGLNLGSGKDLNEYKLNGKDIPYHLIDIANPAKAYSLYNYQRDCYTCLKSIFSRSKAAILCGGSGLYLEAVLKNYHIPAVPENPHFRKEWMKKDKETLVMELKKKDPMLFRKTDSSSKKRLVRSLEVHFFGEKEKPRDFCPPKFNFHIYYLNPPVKILQERIGRRIETRLESGMIEEVERLVKNGVPHERLQQLGLEYQLISQYLLNQFDLADLKLNLYQRIRKFSKSQGTYFRGMERRGMALQPIWGESTQLLRKHINFILP